MSLAERTRTAAREHPFLVAALRAGVLNYAAAARFLDVDGDPEAVATALRRFGEDLPGYETTERDARVTMHRGVGPADGDPLLSVGDLALAPDDGDLTAVVASGGADAAALRAALQRLAVEEVAVEAAAAGNGTLVVVVGRRAGPDALRAVESALESAPE